MNKVKPLFENHVISSKIPDAIIVPEQHLTSAPIQELKLYSPASSGISNPRIVKLLATFDSATGILEYGKDVMSNISAKSDKLLDEVKDSDVEFVETQMRSILTMAKSLNLKPKNKDDGWISNLFSRAKEHFVDAKEQLMSEFNDMSSQMDRVISQVEQANSRIIDKVVGLQAQYKENLQDYKNLDIIIKDAEEAFFHKKTELEILKHNISNALDAQSLNRMISNLDRLDKKIDNMKKFQLMCLQDAPSLAQMEDNAITLLEKFETIKTMTIPLWKKQIRMYIDGQELHRAARLGTAVDDANNAMIKANSSSNKEIAIETTRLNQRAIIDDSTAEEVHKNLLDTLDEVININDEGRQRRIDSSKRMEEMHRLYASIASGQTSIKNAKKQSISGNQLSQNLFEKIPPKT